MKVLYAIQGKGIGHISRAAEIIPELQKYCETDILISGNQNEIRLPFKVKYRCRGLSFVFGKEGSVESWNTYVDTSTKNFWKEISSVPVEDYDFVLNDFEPVSAWACYNRKIPCMALSHQSAIIHSNSPKPKKNDFLGNLILKNFAPSNLQFGLHFGKYAPNIFTPVIQQSIRAAKPTNKGHYTVYLPSYNDKKIIGILRQIPAIKWQLFSKNTSVVQIEGNIEIYPVHNESFVESLVSSTGVLCGAGFETPAEALHLGKKLMVAPLKNQYEQQCNAAALKQMGVTVLNKFKEKNLEKILNWIESNYSFNIEYPDNTSKMISYIFESHIQELIKSNFWGNEYQLQIKEDKEFYSNSNYKHIWRNTQPIPSISKITN
ncbi:MAG: hypothetical protein JXA77_13505 [Bacteroidales bacterium]|nr:hypothetical protein [Bacteroidales bacterium]MBN2818480.1 hypothetical protein [Bacteroidales bacterium]